MLQVLKDTDTALPPSSEVKLPSRVLRLPLAFGDQWTKAAIERCTLRSTSRGPIHAVRHMCDGPEHLTDPDDLKLLRRYMKSARNDAPYLPSNIDFCAANNGLPGGADDVEKTLMNTSYMVLGLGGVCC